MTHSSVEPMLKPSRIRDFDRATEKKSRRFKKHNVDNGKRRDGFEMAKVVDQSRKGGELGE